MTRSIAEIHQRVERLRSVYAASDQRKKDVRDVRSGDVDTVMPSSMPDMWPKPIVANLIDTTARDIAEMIGAMPSINCSTGGASSAAAKQKSNKRTKHANYIVQQSSLPAGRQIEFADHYTTYGAGYYVVEPDFDRKIPIIRIENPIGVYPETNVFGLLVSYTRCWMEEAAKLVSKYPELLRLVQGNQGSTGNWGERKIEVRKYIDRDQMILYLPALSQHIVQRMDNVFGEVPVSPAFRPGFDDECRGAFDDAIWVYLAKSRMALLGLEATEKTVRAPLAVPRDVQKMTFGADAVIRSDSPEKIRLVGTEFPQASFQQEQMLDMELSKATRTPEVRSGNIDASIITGKGVQALMGSFNTVITTGQTVIAQALKKAIEIALRMDEKLWPDEPREIRGIVNGAAFQETYIASRDMKGDYTTDVTYGFAAGQDPARAIVALLQLRGDQLVSRDFVQRQLPMDLDVVQMQARVDVEQLEDALKAGIQQSAASIGAMAAQGADPREIITQIAKIIEMRAAGKSIHEAVSSVMAPKETPQAAPEGPQIPGAPPGTIGPPAGAPAGAQGVPGGPGGPTGMDMVQLLAGLKGGQANMSSTLRRRVPA